MRVRADVDSLEVLPGERGELTLEVMNTGAVIDGITARVIGLPESQVSSRPALLPLFPDSAGELTLTVALPRSFPAGRHPVSIEVNSRQPGVASEYVDVDVVVPQVPAMGLATHPQVVRARRTGRFVLSVANRGNVAMDVSLTAADPERALGVTVTPAAFSVLPAGTIDVLVSVRAPRVLLGTEFDRPIQLAAAARPAGTLIATPPADRPADAGLPVAVGSIEPAPGTAGTAGTAGGAGTAGTAGSAGGVGTAGVVGGAAADDGVTPPAEPLQASTSVTLRHRPYFTRGMLTAVILVAVIGLWASVFLFGIGQVFAGDPLTKTAPASFFATAKAPATGPSLAANALTASGSALPTPADGSDPDPAPAGALPKSGAMPAGLGGTMAGTVTAASDHQPVGRILVTAQRRAADGQLEDAGSAATQADGSYEIPGLFPGRYLVKAAADGFNPVYHPKAASIGAAVPVTVDTAAVTASIDLVITGLPASINGSVDLGDTLVNADSTVSITPLYGANQTTAVATVKTVKGAYTVPRLPAPGDYELTFDTPGYQRTVVQTTVAGGAHRLMPTTPLSAATGSISGTVLDAGTGVGGVVITTTVNGAAVTIGTPTTGAVGHFQLDSLPTPATYVITFSAKGFGQLTIVQALRPGERKTGVRVPLVKGTGVISGRLADASGAGLGGAVVTVGGAINPPTTTTLTNGSVGSFRLDGLPSPGSYTLTFTLPGYTDATVPVTLSDTSAVAPLTVTMSPGLGRVSGTVTDSSGQPMVNAAVVATDGRKNWPVTSTAASGTVPAGGYVIDQLPPGVYTVTATSADGTVTRTAVVTVTAGAATVLNFPLVRAG